MVKEAAHGNVLQAGCVYVAPGARHLKLIRRENNVIVELTDDPTENSCRPSVDYTLRSIAEVYRDRVLTIIMTGMGKDGLEGCTELRKLGGVLFAQDEATSAVYGMPKAVIDAGLVDRVLPLGKIAAAINRHVHRSRIVRSS
jgi:two-component system chemotaxis response regulator CheB